MSLNEPGDDVQGDAVFKKQECLGFVLDEAESGAFVAFEDGDFLARECGGQGCGHSSKVNNPGDMDQRSNTLIRELLFWGSYTFKLVLEMSPESCSGGLMRKIQFRGLCRILWKFACVRHLRAFNKVAHGPSDVAPRPDNN